MRRRSRDEPSGAASWLTTYSDMVTLLLTFFVLLFSFSSVDVAKFSAIISAFQGYFGILDGGMSLSESALPLPFEASELSRQQLLELFEDLSDFIAEEGLEGVHLELEERGLTVRFADRVFFDLGEAVLKPEARAILDKISPILRDLPNPLRVEGHTDDWPIQTSRFPSNWELSVHRATNVVRYLIEEEDFDAQKLSAAGYSEYRPVLPNDTAENRALNRRVDLVIMSIDLWDQEPN
ncbi:MAG: OmpA family protein [Firmicutes bacterium]|nr:OmpA family protein [Bacillota bacterium]